MIATGVPFSAYRRSRKIDAKTAITKAICHICTAAPRAAGASQQLSCSKAASSALRPQRGGTSSGRHIRPTTRG